MKVKYNFCCDTRTDLWNLFVHQAGSFFQPQLLCLHSLYLILLAKLCIINSKRRTYSLSFRSNFWIKSLASSEISLKTSSSKSYLAIVTFAIVSISVAPMNGDNPDSLQETQTCSHYHWIVNIWDTALKPECKPTQKVETTHISSRRVELWCVCYWQYMVIGVSSLKQGQVIFFLMVK